MTSIRNSVIASQKAPAAVFAKFTVNQVFAPADFLLLSIAVAKPGRGMWGYLLRHLCIAEGFVMRQHQSGQFSMEKHFEK